MTETRVTYVVQCWHAAYDYWGDVAEHPASLFSVTVSSYTTPEEARQRREALLVPDMDPDMLRVIRRTVTEETI